jgi:hypothetical protein
MEKIEIKKSLDIVIVEKSKGFDILKGSKFYCGCCGNVLGEAKKKITLPISAETFQNSLKNKTFDITHGLHHRTCGHTMFTFNKIWAFITLDSCLQR